MIADVLDETNGLLLFRYSSEPFLQSVFHYWFNPVYGVYRPLVITVAVFIARWSPSYDWAWHLLRWVNISLLLGSLAFFCSIIRRRSDDKLIMLMFVALFLFSGAAFITAGWGACMFDAAVLFLIGAGFFMLEKKNYIIAGALMGMGFFCKETALLAVPLLIIWKVNGFVERREFVISVAVTACFGLAYFTARQASIPLGSQQDLHGFSAGSFIPTAAAWFESFWFQNLSRKGAEITGFFFTLFSLFCLKKTGNIVGVTIMMFLCVILYWGMLEYRGESVIHAAAFAGRLYLIPVTFFIVLLALRGKRYLMLILMIPILWGAYETYSGYGKYQKVYQNIYQLAEKHDDGPLKVHFPRFPLEDKRRNLLIGKYPNAGWYLDAESGRLIRINVECSKD